MRTNNNDEFNVNPLIVLQSLFVFPPQVLPLSHNQALIVLRASQECGQPQMPTLRL